MRKDQFDEHVRYLLEEEVPYRTAKGKRADYIKLATEVVKEVLVARMENLRLNILRPDLHRLLWYFAGWLTYTEEMKDDDSRFDGLIQELEKRVADFRTKELTHRASPAYVERAAALKPRTRCTGLEH